MPRQPAGRQAPRAAEHRIEAFADDLGRLLGTATAKAEHWLNQRAAIAKTLTQIRNTANTLLTELTAKPAARAARQVRLEAPRVKRRLSAAARKAISDAQKRRWAAVRAKAKQ